MSTALPLPPATPWPWPPLLKASVALHAGAAAAALLPGLWPWALGAVAANHALITAAGLWPRSGALGPNVTRLPRTDGIAITLDDGPDPEVTPRVLDQLDSAGARASFFLIGARAERHPALVREIVRRGHDVQNHSQSHRHHFSLSGPAALAREVERSQQVLADLSGQAPVAFRAPAGLRNPFLDPVLHHLGLHLVSWTRRGYDTRRGQPDRLLERLAGGLAGGDILLLHDGHAARAPDGLPVLLHVLPTLLQRCRDAGLAPLTLREALPPRHPR